MTDLWGPVAVQSIGGYKYFIPFMDDCTRIGQVLFLREKSEAVKHVKDHCTKVERQFRKFPCWIRFDNGKEFVNAELKEWAASKGIELETTAPYSSSQNGVAERYNQTLLDLARAMLLAKKLPDILWDEVCHTRTTFKIGRLLGH